MYTLDEINSKITEAIKQVRLNKEPRNLYEPISYILGMGGKRIRPALLLAACNLYSDEIDNAIPASIAVEIFHNFTLVHDDIMDKATMRRGFETIHKRWNDNIAILSGDAMTILAYQFLNQVDKEVLPEVISIFNSFAIGICEGQQMDMDFETLEMVSKEDYLKMIELKTSVLLKGALQIGVVIGGASSDDVELIGEFGRTMGLAFQLQDDLLDTYGKSDVFGKRIGGDIISAKKTMLSIETYHKLDDTAKKEFLELYNRKDIEGNLKIQKVKEYFGMVKVKESIESLINEYFEKAQSSLNLLSVDPSRKIVLSNILNKLIGRES
ncbi:MAG: geranylgeranyl diphosphate synthase, type [Tenuifilum sp.]|jgi:geranylgeranyl diphosphate synthase type II|uniref:polyprenyl synthetase family protein n=1 Tax=Tenuifilum sp. TaxID=2760880 RepID=UPI0024AC2997|nr:polyprenyl synthetase family protein [Tenuifilum sp.]MDI3526663.1 geranylgeranyl diphosphate synthase, type [Tenuifilum sp.]